MARPPMKFKKTEMRNALALADQFGYTVTLSADGSIRFEPAHVGRKREAPSATKKSIEDYIND